jgi:ParB-like chromosome segregation protein Spo0J
VQAINISDIVIPENRWRRDFDAAKITELASSIASKGLQHAVVLRNDRRTLVAGERRLRAIRQLRDHGVAITHNNEPVPLGAVPFVVLAQLDDLALREAEYEENAIRTDFSWLERTEAIAKLHKLREAQAKERGEVQTLRQTATEISGRNEGEYATRIRRAVLLHDYASDPEVAAAKSEKEAFNIVKRKLTDTFTAALAKNIQAEARQVPHTALLGDCNALFATLDAGVFDVLITDPPYGIEAHTFSATDGNESATQHRYDDSWESASAVIRGIIDEGTRVCKPDAAMYMFCDHSRFEWLSGYANARGWTAWPRPIFWHKPAGGMMGDTTRGPRRSYETIFFAYRGNKRTTGTFLDVIVHQPRDDARHAAAKPVEVYVNLLRRSALPGMLVLDPCMGSGPVFPASNLLQLRATGMEIVESHYNTALSRINGKE